MNTAWHHPYGYNSYFNSYGVSPYSGFNNTSSSDGYGISTNSFGSLGYNTNIGEYEIFLNNNYGGYAFPPYGYGGFGYFDNSGNFHFPPAIQTSTTENNQSQKTFSPMTPPGFGQDGGFPSMPVLPYAEIPDNISPEQLNPVQNNNDSSLLSTALAGTAFGAITVSPKLFNKTTVKKTNEIIKLLADPKMSKANKKILEELFENSDDIAKIINKDFSKLSKYSQTELFNEIYSFISKNKGKKIDPNALLDIVNRKIKTLLKIQKKGSDLARIIKVTTKHPKTGAKIIKNVFTSGAETAAGTVAGAATAGASAAGASAAGTVAGAATKTAKVLSKAKGIAKTTAKIGGKTAGPIIIVGMEAISQAADLKAAYKDSTSEGLKQTGKSAVKVGASLAGFALGAKAGAAAGASIGALFGGVGAVPGAIIGTVLGVAGGCIGSWLTTKTADAIVGENYIAQQAKKNKTFIA